jgi:hypothetical protein
VPGLGGVQTSPDSVPYVEKGMSISSCRRARVQKEEGRSVLGFLFSLLPLFHCLDVAGKGPMVCVDVEDDPDQSRWNRRTSGTWIDPEEDQRRTDLEEEDRRRAVLEEDLGCRPAPVSIRVVGG